MAVGTAPGVAVPMVAAAPATNMDVDTADDLFADIDDFDPTSVWGDDDEGTAAPDRALRAGASADAHGSAMKKRRRQDSRATTRAAQKHCQRMVMFGAARGNTPRSGPGPVEKRPAGGLG